MYNIPDNIKGLIFDFDGTLVDSMEVHLLSWRESFRKNGLEFDEKLFYEKAGVSLVGVVDFYNKKHGTSLDPYEIANLKNHLHKEFITDLTVIEPVFDIVKENFGKRPMAIATGNHRDVTLLAMDYLEIGDYFQAVVSAEDVKNSKPAPDCFLKAAELINIKPEFCEVFEDGEPGLQGARDAGMKATDIRPWLKTK